MIIRIFWATTGFPLVVASCLAFLAMRLAELPIGRSPKRSQKSQATSASYRYNPCREVLRSKRFTYFWRLN